jgi:hypothetical protein
MTGILNALFASLAGGPTETTVEYLVIAGGGAGGNNQGGGGAGGYRTNYTSLLQLLRLNNQVVAGP